MNEPIKDDNARWRTGTLPADPEADAEVLAVPMPTCSSCGAPVFWAVSVNGARMPVDAEPVADGNVLVTVNQRTGEKKAVVLARDAVVPAGRNRYTSHHATCPNAAQHRKGRKKQ